METMVTIMRSMENTFDCAKFRRELWGLPLNAAHREMLNLHFSLLESCLEGGSPKNRVSTYFKKGHLTIIECVLSPFDWCAWLTQVIQVACHLHSLTDIPHVASSTSF